jgi:radical SAM family uncharacterized protein
MLSNYEKLAIGLRLCRGLFLDWFGAKAPLFGGHKLTYNCNLKCKMCPFWKRQSKDLSTENEKQILKQIYNSGVCGIGFEGGEPLLRNDLAEILAYSRALPLHTSLITNGTLLKSKIDEIAPYISGMVFVSLDGLEKTHDQIRGVNGCFKKAVQGIDAAKDKVSIIINTTMTAENIYEVEDIVRLAKDLGVRIVLSKAHEYHNINASAPQDDEVTKVAKRLIELKKKGFPIFNTTEYFKVVAKEKKWKCKPWSIINVGTDGRLVLPCYVYNQYETDASVFENNIKTVTSSFDWQAISNCKKCSLHCYVEPSLVLSGNFSSWVDWAFHTRA